MNKQIHNHYNLSYILKHRFPVIEQQPSTPRLEQHLHSDISNEENMDEQLQQEDRSIITS